MSNIEKIKKIVQKQYLNDVKCLVGTEWEKINNIPPISVVNVSCPINYDLGAEDLALIGSVFNPMTAKKILVKRNQYSLAFAKLINRITID